MQQGNNNTNNNNSGGGGQRPNEGRGNRRGGRRHRGRRGGGGGSAGNGGNTDQQQRPQSDQRTQTQPGNRDQQSGSGRDNRRPHGQRSGSGSNQGRGQNRRDGRRPQHQHHKGRTTTPQKPRDNFDPAIVEKHTLKKYGVIFFETFAAAKTEKAQISEAAKQCEQLNIVIKAEGDMDDAEFKEFGKLFAGEAWYLIHERRVADGWYNEPR